MSNKINQFLSDMENRTALGNQDDNLNKLIEMNRVLLEALEYYSQPGIYDFVHTARIGVNGEAGAKARAAIDKCEKIVGEK